MGVNTQYSETGEGGHCPLYIHLPVLPLACLLTPCLLHAHAPRYQLTIRKSNHGWYDHTYRLSLYTWILASPLYNKVWVISDIMSVYPLNTTDESIFYAWFSIRKNRSLILRAITTVRLLSPWYHYV